MSDGGVLTRLVEFVGDESNVLYECKRCGTNVDAETEVCPACGSEEIGRFVL